MKFAYLSETVTVKKVKESEKEGVFEIGGLYAGYGLTVGNALRRTLLSSIPGAAVTQMKIKGVGHEFSTIEGVVEDVTEIMLNLKNIRLAAYTDEPKALTLKVKGEGEVKAKDIKTDPDVRIVTPEAHIATLTSRNAELDMELVVERGLGYVPAEARQLEKLPIGTVVLDAAFSPVLSVNFTIENMRVGERTDFNRLIFSIGTDGSISPSAALRKAANILKDHFDKISQVEVTEILTEETPVEGEGGKKAAKKKAAGRAKKTEKAE